MPTTDTSCEFEQKRNIFIKEVHLRSENLYKVLKFLLIWWDENVTQRIWLWMSFFSEGLELNKFGNAEGVKKLGNLLWFIQFFRFNIWGGTKHVLDHRWHGKS